MGAGASKHCERWSMEMTPSEMGGLAENEKSSPVERRAKNKVFLIHNNMVIISCFEKNVKEKFFYELI